MSSENLIKESQLIAAAIENNVDVLRNLLDSPKWYNIKHAGYTLLQTAIRSNSIEVFDYLLSIPDFPFDYIDHYGETALTVALSAWSYGHWRKKKEINEHFAYELIKKGAGIDKKICDGKSFLYYAVNSSYAKVAELLIQKGTDVIDEGETLLQLCLQLETDCSEILSTLLVYGAKPSIEIFEESVLKHKPHQVQESLFLYLFDNYSKPAINLNVLFKLAEIESPLFFEIVKCPDEIIVSDHFCDGLNKLSLMNIKFLIVLLEKCSFLVEAILFLRRNSSSSLLLFDNIERLNVMIESDIKLDVIDYISHLSCSRFRQRVFYEGGEATTTERYCYLLSYGLQIDEKELQYVYKSFGYCELFKILLHMDIIPHEGWFPCSYRAMPKLIYDVNMDLEEYIRKPYEYKSKSVHDLVSYFAHPKLKEIYCDIYDRLRNTETYRLKQDIPQIPLLVELARNVLRKFLVETFQIKTSRKFYTLLKCLPISSAQLKIITYETKLY